MPARYLEVEQDRLPTVLLHLDELVGPTPTDLRSIIRLVSNTTTTGVVVHADHDPNWYPKGFKINNREFNALSIHRHNFHGDWNYTITPTNHVRP